MTSSLEDHASSSGANAPQEWLQKLGAALPSWRVMAHALGLRRLQDLLQGTCSRTDQPVWLLGIWYGVADIDNESAALPPEVAAALLQDFSARLWFTYRREFAPLDGAGLTSDVGWGCTLRSGQMLLAESLMRHTVGRHLRPPATEPEAAVVARIARLFHDAPGPEHPFSIHNICRVGAPHGVVAGQWLGPWVLCHALRASVEEHQRGLDAQHGRRRWRRLEVHVAASPGGGAPSLQPSELQRLLHGAAVADGRAVCQLEPGGAGEAGETASGAPGGAPGGEVAAALEPKAHAGGGPRGAQCTSDSQPASPARSSDASSGVGNGPSVQQQPPPGLLLLIPLTLGVGKVHDLYLTQLRDLLAFPHSVGIVGGRPGASLYFVGAQGPGSVLFLDPHEVKEVPKLPRDLGAFSCSAPRAMPAASIDPSLAIGLYCGSLPELEDLLARLAAMAAASRGAPLVTVDDAGGAAGGWPPVARAAPSADGGGGAADDWEML